MRKILALFLILTVSVLGGWWWVIKPSLRSDQPENSAENGRAEVLAAMDEQLPVAQVDPTPSSSALPSPRPKFASGQLELLARDGEYLTLKLEPMSSDLVFKFSPQSLTIDNWHQAEAGELVMFEDNLLLVKIDESAGEIETGYLGIRRLDEYGVLSAEIKQVEF